MSTVCERKLTIVCCNPFQKHTTPFLQKSKLRTITSNLASTSQVQLNVGEYICHSCRNTVAQLSKLKDTSKADAAVSNVNSSASSSNTDVPRIRNIVCSNPFNLHGRVKRKKIGKSWFSVTDKLSKKCLVNGLNILYGQQLCYDCYVKCLVTLEGESISKESYCADPFSRHKERRKKHPLQFFKFASSKIIQMSKLMGRNLTPDDVICSNCRFYIKRFKVDPQANNERKKDPANDELNGLHAETNKTVEDSEVTLAYLSDSDHSECSSISNGSEYYDSDIELDSINQVLKNLKLDAVTKSCRHTDDNLSKLYVEIGEGVKSSLVRLAKRNIELEKPIFMSSETCKCKECRICIAAFAEKIKSTANKLKKYQLLTCTPQNLTIREIELGYSVSQRMAQKSYTLKKTSGIFSSPPKRIGKKLSDKLVQEVEAFYLNSENSTTCPEQRKTVIVRYFENGKWQKKPVARQEMRVTLKDLHKEFRLQYPNHVVSISKFSILKPKQCKWGNSKGFQQTCKCIQHENFKLILEALNKTGKTKDLLTPFFCSLNEICLFGLCPNCPHTNSIAEQLEETGEALEYMEWFKGNNRCMELIKKSVTREEYSVSLQQIVEGFGPHYYVHVKQRDHINYVQSKALEGNCEKCVLLVDFGENYSFVLANEVQSFHWNNSQATILPCILYFYCEQSKKIKTVAFVVLSDSMRHDATAFCAFRSKVVDQIKVMFPKIKFITYVSDNCGGQFKNKKNFCNLSYHYYDFGINAKWIFSAAGHGKGLSDAYSAITKRCTRLESLRRGSQNPIINTRDMFTFLLNDKTTDTLKFLYVTEVDINNFVAIKDIERRYEGLKTVTGTRQFHDVEVGSNHKLQFKKISDSDQSFEFNLYEERKENEEDLILSGINVGSHIAFLIANQFITGTVDSVHPEEFEYEVKLMKKLTKGKGYQYTDKTDFVPFIDVLGHLEVPTTITGRAYFFDETVYSEMIKRAENRIKQTKIKM